MEGILPIAVWITIILIGLGLLAIAAFGIRSLLYGKISPLTFGIILAPILVLAGIGLVTGDWVLAGIWTVVITFVLASIAMVITGVRSVFS